MAGEGGDGEIIMRLPENCISYAISLTTPADSCRSSAVCTAFLSAADSDIVWRRFLPDDYEEILARAVDPVEFSSKKELYFRLCDSILVDGGSKSFWLERSTGRRCYTLSARELDIFWGDTPSYWKWEHCDDSRFSEAAQLLDRCWHDILGTLDRKLLTPRTNYAAFLIFKHPYLDMMEPSTHEISSPGRTPHGRADGWMELELAEFFNDDGDEGEVKLQLWEIDDWKSGFMIEGIEVRPK